MKTKLPKHLIEQADEGNLVLFLGSGASVGANHPENKKVPLGQELSDMIAEKFLGDSYKGKNLDYISELAISESDLFSVQKFIADIFKKFEPSEYHKLIPTFVWKAILTTNYDLIIETAYNSVKNPLQELVVFKKNGERINEKLSSRKSLIYNKLHGCITEINDETLPLILTPDQYIKYRKNRSRLFERLKELAYEYSFIFVGFSFADIDIRTIFNDLEIQEFARPKFYMVGPAITDEELRLWEKKNITSLRLTFEEFLNLLDQSINPQFRWLSTEMKAEHELPIFKKFKGEMQNQKPSKNLTNFLESDVDYLHSNFTTIDSDPKKFYKGYFDSWDPIIKNFDVNREKKDEILSEIFLQDESERLSKNDFYVLKGHAGSGKTVLLKRIAWDAATEFGKFCLYLKPDSVIKFELLRELYYFCRERVFLFIDRPVGYIGVIIRILQKSRENNIPITIISTERIHVWNTECGILESYLTQEYILEYLKDQEIENLVSLLAKHDSLGYLKNKSMEERINALSEKAGRELLVALHEATLGKPFEEIILDEYNSINNDEAKSLYLTICMMHRLGVHTRAGLISRVHKISFSHFKQYLFDPLESIVFHKYFRQVNDRVFFSRHQHIAELVFEQVLVDEQRKHEEFVRIITYLDIDYKSDRLAFISMTNAKKLLDTFKDLEIIRNIFKIARMRDSGNPHLMQQEAIFEMTAKDGDLKKSENLLNQAYNENPNNLQISHSLAEFSLKRAEKETNKLLKEKYIKKGQDICSSLLNKNHDNPHPYHTLMKIYLLQLKEIFSEGINIKIENKIKEFERVLNKIKQIFPQNAFILESEANFNELLEREPQALNALKQAHETDKHSPYITLRLADFYEKKSELDNALKILDETLKLNPNEKNINLKYAILLSRQTNPDYSEVKYYFRKSFTTGDSRYNAQFLYARCLYILGEYSNAQFIFNRLGNVNLDERTIVEPRGTWKENGKHKTFKGTIIKVETSYGFIKKDFIGDTVFFHRKHNNNVNWYDLKTNCRVIFNLAFNYRGAIAVKMEIPNLG